MMMQKIRQTDGQTDNSDFIGSSVGQGSKISNLEKYNSLWEGKIIVNQIVLSEIWFLSQIYTIRKYIKKKTEKKIRNFLSNYKKMSIPGTYNPGQGMWSGVEKSSKIGEEEKCLISTFAVFFVFLFFFLTAITEV